jgi:hypothetical protein
LTGHFALTGGGLCVGYAPGDAVPATPNQFEFMGGEILEVVFDIADAYIDVERRATGWIPSSTALA